MKFRVDVLVSVALFCFGPTSYAGKPAGVPAEMLETARTSIYERMRVKPEVLDVDKPLMEQGATRSDLIVAIVVMEKTFNVIIPDESVLVEGDYDKTLTVRRLVEIVLQQPKKKR